ncbi:MAG TPA: SMP-30/gluconolactonase/LRE family protein [Blastocatellia bacterium]|nr:SMP-30/gluconolactonase/LRE family protein [Blastocatellia bacterium]
MITRNTFTRKMLGAASAAVFAILAANQLNAQPGQPDRPFGDVQVLGAVPASTGFPEGIAARGNRIYVAGPARFGTAGDGTPSRVFEYDIDNGALLRTFDIQGENLNQDHANSCIAFDDDGRLYVVNIQLGIVRLDLGSGQQEVYAAPLPNLPPCSSVAPGNPCSPTFFDGPPLPNDIAFDDDGNLYETDSFQATIWMIPAGGGQPQIWFQDSRLDTPFGANGLKLSPDRTTIYFSVTADSVGQFGNFLGGKIYTLPLVANPSAAQLQVFHEYNGEAPDGIAFGRSGKLYVTLAAPFNSGVSILDSGGTEAARLHNDQDPTFPYDSPANIAFNKQGSIVITNHAFATMIPGHFVVLDVFVDDKESPLVKP